MDISSQPFTRVIKSWVSILCLFHGFSSTKDRIQFWASSKAKSRLSSIIIEMSSSLQMSDLFFRIFSVKWLVKVTDSNTFGKCLCNQANVGSLVHLSSLQVIAKSLYPESFSLRITSILQATGWMPSSVGFARLNDIQCSIASSLDRGQFGIFHQSWWTRESNSRWCISLLCFFANSKEASNVAAIVSSKSIPIFFMVRIKIL